MKRKHHIYPRYFVPTDDNGWSCEIKYVVYSKRSQKFPDVIFYEGRERQTYVAHGWSLEGMKQVIKEKLWKEVPQEEVVLL